jgi:2,4-diketo-3-deoxy-L-fuconate hydrolase
MKLVRYGAPAAEKPGLIANDGSLRSLAPLIADLTPEMLSPETLQILHGVDPMSLPSVEGAPRYGVPVNGIRQIVAVGLNYRKHAEEAGMALPVEPLLFSKAIASLSGANDDIVLYRDRRRPTGKSSWAS